MDLFLKRANFSWFRMMLIAEPDEAKRQELERKLAQAEAEFEDSLSTHALAPIPPAANRQDHQISRSVRR